MITEWRWHVLVNFSETAVLVGPGCPLPLPQSKPSQQRVLNAGMSLLKGSDAAAPADLGPAWTKREEVILAHIGSSSGPGRWAGVSQPLLTQRGHLHVGPGEKNHTARTLGHTAPFSQSCHWMGEESTTWQPTQGAGHSVASRPGPPLGLVESWPALTWAQACPSFSCPVEKHCWGWFPLYSSGTLCSSVSHVPNVL